MHIKLATWILVAAVAGVLAIPLGPEAKPVGYSLDLCQAIVATIAEDLGVALAGRKVAVVRGTTNEAAMREIDRLRGLGITFAVADGYGEALAVLESGGADALAAADVLLQAQLATSGKVRDFRVVGAMLSFEPYGIMYPRDDPALADAVERTLRALAQSREIVWLYNRWFVRPLPSGVQLDLPMSTQLRRSLELIGLPPD